MQDAGANGATRPSSSTRQKPQPKSPGADLPRTICFALDDDAQWAERSLESKTVVTLTEASMRLRGLANVIFGDGMRTPDGIKRAIFLGGAVSDLALALERIEKAWREKWEQDDAASLAQKRAGKAAEGVA